MSKPKEPVIVPEAASAIVRAVIMEHKIHRNDFFETRYFPAHIVKARIDAVARLFDAGYSRPAICAAIGKSDFTVSRMLARAGRGRVMTKYADRPDIKEAVNEVLAERHLTYDQLIDHDRRTELVSARAAVARKLAGMRCSKRLIAEVLDRDRATVTHLLNRVGGNRRRFDWKDIGKHLSEEAKDTLLDQAEARKLPIRKIAAEWIEEKALAVRIWGPLKDKAA